jgi:ribonuclease Y
VQQAESALRGREAELAKKQGTISGKEVEVERREKTVAGREQAADATAKRAEELLNQTKEKLQKLAGMSAEEAKAELVAQVVDEAKKQAATEIKKIEDGARSEAEEKARRILGMAIQRYAGEYVTERTVSVVPLPDDNMKGRIIGREGRNIRALEAATGIDLIIDDTPEAVIISCFNPVRREIAKLALTRLIADGRIHPTRIEELVQKCTDEVEARARLEKIAGLTAAEAKAKLYDEVRDEARRAAADEVRKIEESARAEADEKSRMVVSAAVQRYASEYVAERTVATVPLPSDEMKGRIIGREGRNVRALEAATGVDLIIDDTPEAVVISCFNPVRREIARLALTRLIADGRIHPTRIEEMVEKATAEIEQQCKEAGEQAAFDLGLPRLHPELTRLVGKLKFRSSNAQNLLQHSVEVAFLAGAMAAELDLPVKTARRAGLLHDIGKAIEQEAEGSHAAVGAATARKFGEPPRVVQAIAAHHGEVAPGDVLDHLVDAANVLSGQRPGARREMLESYVQRLGDLERVATGFPGVERAFAIQAGREVRVIVENSRVTDQEARLLSKDIARKVEAELAYPGQVRVSVIRETRATDYAK